MSNSFQVGDNVTRIKGDYVVGRTGVIIDLDAIRRRARVQWRYAPKTWVSFDVIGHSSEWIVENYKARRV